MRIGFLEKGGSGKTTIAAGYTRWLAKQGREVLAIDGDVNVHLGRTLGMETKDIGSLFSEVSAELEPNRKNKNPFIGTTPPVSQSKFIHPSSYDAFLQKYATQMGKISLLTVGTYDDKHLGTQCYHGILGIVEFIGGRLLDGANDRVVLDMTAGIDSVGTSMFFTPDLNAFVVEPTMKSVAVYLDFKKHVENVGITPLVILNKIEDEDDEAFVRQYIASSEIIAVFSKSKRIKEFEQGQADALENFVNENTLMFSKIDDALASKEKDWEGYYQKLVKVYKDNCETWYNGFYGQDLTLLIDPEFSYKKVIGE